DGLGGGQCFGGAVRTLHRRTELLLPCGQISHGFVGRPPTGEGSQRAGEVLPGRSGSEGDVQAVAYEQFVDALAGGAERVDVLQTRVCLGQRGQTEFHRPFRYGDPGLRPPLRECGNSGVSAQVDEDRVEILQRLVRATVYGARIEQLLSGLLRLRRTEAATSAQFA